MKRSSFIFHKEWEEPLSMLDSADQGRVMMAMIRYDNGETVDLSDSPTAAMAFAFIRTRMDEDREKWEETCSRRSDAGKKAAEARWDASDAKRMERNAKNAKRINRINENANDANDADNDNEYDNDNENENENDKEKESLRDSKKKSPTPKKNQYGFFKNVLLTDEEYHKLREKYTDFADRIERLSGYIESTGKRYKSHYATILNWARRDEEQGKGRDRPNDYTLEAYRAKQAEHPEDEGIYEVF